MYGTLTVTPGHTACVACTLRGRVQSGGPNGMSQVCGCCHGNGQHAPNTTPRCAPTGDH